MKQQKKKVTKFFLFVSFLARGSGVRCCFETRFYWFICLQWHRVAAHGTERLLKDASDLPVFYMNIDIKWYQWMHAWSLFY